MLHFSQSLTCLLSRPLLPGGGRSVVADGGGGGRESSEAGSEAEVKGHLGSGVQHLALPQRLAERLCSCPAVGAAVSVRPSSCLSVCLSAPSLTFMQELGRIQAHMQHSMWPVQDYTAVQKAVLLQS